MFLGLLLGFGASLPSHASETSIEERIGRIDEGKVHLTFASRPGVYGNGRNITTTEPGDDWEPSPDMERGPVRVLLRYRDSEVVEVETYVGGRWREDTGARDLGSVPVPAATEFLLGLARHGGHAWAAADAIFPATLGEGAAPWEELLAIAKLESRPREVRESALFWLGQAAGEKISAQLAGFVEDPLEDLELREHAVFVLSQRPDVESLPALLRIARSHPSPGVRRAALFWLGQKEDPRVYQLLEEILLGS